MVQNCRWNPTTGFCLLLLISSTSPLRSNSQTYPPNPIKFKTRLGLTQRLQFNEFRQLELDKRVNYPVGRPPSRHRRLDLDSSTVPQPESIG